MSRHGKQREFSDEVANIVDQNTLFRSSSEDSARTDYPPSNSTFLQMLFNLCFFPDVGKRRIKGSLRVRCVYHFFKTCLSSTVNQHFGVVGNLLPWHSQGIIESDPVSLDQGLATFEVLLKMLLFEDERNILDMLRMNFPGSVGVIGKINNFESSFYEQLCHVPASEGMCPSDTYFHFILFLI